MIPVRLQRAAKAAPLWGRVFGAPEWSQFGAQETGADAGQAGQPTQGGPPAEHIFTLWARVLAGELTMDTAIKASQRLETPDASALKGQALSASSWR